MAHLPVSLAVITNILFEFFITDTKLFVMPDPTPVLTIIDM
jgi:hypothetical protein